jgi:hypothetical protein
MPLITKAGWPLHAAVECDICDCNWNIDIGDLARCVVDPEAETITVDVDCPGCSTRYRASKRIGAARTPSWERVPEDEQYNIEVSAAEHMDDVAGVHDVSAGKLGMQSLAETSKYVQTYNDANTAKVRLSNFGPEAFAPPGHVHGDPAQFHEPRKADPTIQGPKEQAYAGASDI